VKFWRNEKGHGAISADATHPFDIWVHFSAIEADGYVALSVGETVEVVYERADQDSFRYRAVSVRATK
jgi:CspA family cold shock protein